ncbi:MAG: 4-hydroxythreonine-4-phosphate dehydrogenase PdxA [Phycisphaerae bacterium]
MADERPILAITMGDPAGIGPEITIKALEGAGAAEVYRECRPVVVGDAGVMRNALAFMQFGLKLKVVDSPGKSEGTPGVMDVLDLHNVDAEKLQLGKVSAAAGEAAFQAITRSIELAMANEIDGVVTNPIHKEALHLAGHKFPGHTEIFAHYTGSKESVMMLAEGHFRVAHVSTHVSLKEAVARCTKERVLRVIEMAAQGCKDLGIPDPHVGVAGINPHAGEHGLFGDEEITAIIPAIKEAQGRGIRASGPYPADTFLPRAAGGKGEFDICIAMYHDQGHVAVKMRGFSFDPAKGVWNAVKGINVSLGLPIIRVSVDHGTAFDVAGRGIASEASLLDAISYAAKMAHQRRGPRAGVRK